MRSMKNIFRFFHTELLITANSYLNARQVTLCVIKHFNTKQSIFLLKNAEKVVIFIVTEFVKDLGVCDIIFSKRVGFSSSYL